MTHIVIDSKLTSTERTRLNRRADLHAERETAFDNAFIKLRSVGASTYAPLHDDVDPHNVARHMMCVVRRPFDYHLS